MQYRMFRGWGGLRVYAAWHPERGTFTAYARDTHDTVVWQVGQVDVELPTITALQQAIEPRRAYLTVEVVAALLGDQEGGPAALAASGRVGVAQ
ncbi:hypothetical protein GBF35_25725 [Nonomuraea phyllanthi]|uniref:hypothetical protein n=1 Tax=Nonomuraea phyllanthi TaxID=2219224 RepID=UPI001292FB7D|nr:hypothetical protein [Nonomuraea phyllanthi]QFY09599.1 hypothetical protein GBF35_25725 [Nonomuraea phyllanthi]